MMNMGITNCRNLTLKAWQLVALLLCIALFIVLMIDIWCKYTEGMTTVGIRFYGVDKQEKKLPCLTFCPWMAFKAGGFYFKNSDFNKNTFSKEEVFNNLSSWYSGPDSKNFLLEEVRGILQGRCYMVCPLRSFTLGSHERITTNQNLDLKGIV